MVRRIAAGESAAEDELVRRYSRGVFFVLNQNPLYCDDQCSPEYEQLLIIIAVHAERSRRAAGGTQARRVPTLCELAEEIVTKGYQQASKHHHPDGDGHHESQLRLTQARDYLRNTCANIGDENHEDGTIFIPAPPAPRQPVRASAANDFSEDHMPF